MRYDRYVIGLWTQEDEFVTVLASSEEKYVKDGVKPIYNYKTDLDETLSFSIPSSASIQAIFENKNLLINDAKLKLVFYDGAKRTIREFVIEDVVQRREGLQVYWEVSGRGLALKELEKSGTEIVLNSLTVEQEEDELRESGATTPIVRPTLQYWLNKIFPVGDSNWTYEIRMDYSTLFEEGSGAVATKVYDKPDIVSWTVSGNTATPVYGKEPVEKLRLPDIKNSNHYNICHSLAELFEVYARIEYEYKDSNSPYKITKRKVVFYNEPAVESEKAITYGKNEKGLSKTSNSSGIVTKVFVPPLESQYSDSGYASIAEAQANLTKDNFILNFDYYIKSGLMPVQKQALVRPYEISIRQKNIELEKALSAQYNIENLILDKEIELQSAKDELTAAQTVVNNFLDKLKGIGEHLQSNLVKQDPRVYLVTTTTASARTVVLREQGIVASTIKLMNGADKTPITVFDVISDSTGFAKSIVNIGASNPSSSVLVEFSTDVVSFYRQQIATYRGVVTAAEAKIAQISGLLGEENPSPPYRFQGRHIGGTTYSTNSLVVYGGEGYRAISSTSTTPSATGSWRTVLASPYYARRAYYEGYIKLIGEEKNKETATFNKKMGYFLREGNWSSENNNFPYESKVITLPNVKDAMRVELGDEPITYLDGTATTYPGYINFETHKNSYKKIEQLVITQEILVNGEVEKKQFFYGTHFTPSYIKVGANTIFALIFANDTGIETGYGTAGSKLYCANNTAHTLTLVKPSTTAYTRLWQRAIIEDKLARLSTIEVSARGILLKEFEHYRLSVGNDGRRYITLKINNYLTYDTTELNIKYQSDRTTERLYYDARAVSKTSAYPEVSYDVDFVYYGNAVKNIHPSAPDTQIEDEVQIDLATIVRITDPELGFYGVKGIVTEITLDLAEPQNSSFKVQNYKTRFEDLFGRMVASTEQLSSRGASYERAATAIGPTGAIQADIFQSTLSSNIFSFNTGNLSNVHIGEDGIIVEAQAPGANGIKGQVILRNGGIFFSNSVDDHLRRIYSVGITGDGISANAITTGRLDTSLINIYSGDQLRFTWKADGIFAYKSKANGYSDFDNYVKYNEDGLRLIKKVEDSDISRVEVSWDGFILRNDDNINVFYADPDTGNLNITGYIHAMGGIIDESMTVGGSLSSPLFANGALGTGWRIDGDGSAEFNNVYVRGTISASVFEYDKISSVGGSLYIAPTLITMSSAPVDLVSNKYRFSINHGFSTTGTQTNWSAGRNWLINDIVSLQGYIIKYIYNEASQQYEPDAYELKDVRSKIVAFLKQDGTPAINNSEIPNGAYGIILETIETVDAINNRQEYMRWVNEGEEQYFYSNPMPVGEGLQDKLESDAKLIYWGTASEEGTLRKGIYMTAALDKSPFIDIYDQETVASLPQVRLGNLQGITDPRFGPNPLSGYGLYSQNANLTGTMLFVDEQGGAMKLSASGFQIAAPATNPGNWVWSTFGDSSGFNADYITAGTLNAGLIKILGTDQFYWDADNINIYNPNNTSQQIRIGKYDNENYGIGFTEDGGLTWETSLGFDGIHLGSLTINDVNSQLKQVKVEIVSSEGTVYNEDIMPSLPTVLTARIIVGTIPETNLTGYNFQWQKSVDGGTSWTNISGATASTYQYNATILEQVRCMVTR